jgi:hypothetical protein
MTISIFSHFRRFILVVACMGATAFSQTPPQTTITGRVIDDSTSSSLQNANVFIASTTLGCGSNQFGQFEIRNVPFGSYEIVASLVGYRMKSLRVTIAEGRETNFEIRLRAKPIEVGEVVVSATMPEEWKKDFEKFKKLFLGDAENAKQCRILNPEVLDFATDEAGYFGASARTALEIDNMALGYHLQFFLADFRVEGSAFSFGLSGNKNEYLSYGGLQKFTELNAPTPEVEEQWKANRLQSYKGSQRHFFAALFRKELAGEGFMIQLDPKASDRPLMRFYEPPLILDLTEDDILSDGWNAHEKKVHFKGMLIIRYGRKPVAPGNINRLAYAKSSATVVSRIWLNYGEISINASGRIKEWHAAKTYGDWTQNRVADALPLDYAPGQE